MAQPSPTGPAQLPPPVQLMQLIGGRFISAAICTVARLGVAEHLAKGPKSVEDLGKLCQAIPGHLYRVLRMLASLGIFTETAPRTFGLTPLGELLRPDHPGSLHGMAVLFGEEWHWRCWTFLQERVQNGRHPAEAALGDKNPFKFFEKQPGAQKIFANAMTALSNMQVPPLLKNYDWSGFGLVVDVGGSQGALLATLLKANPKMKGIVFDVPPLAEMAAANLKAQGVADRCQFTAGDFFQSVPPGGDAYVMKAIIHDWDDEKCVKILKNCRDAMQPTGKVLIVEDVLPPGDVPSMGKIIDLEMLVMTDGGRERTAEEFGALLAKAGLKLARVVVTHGPAQIIEAVKA